MPFGATTNQKTTSKKFDKSAPVFLDVTPGNRSIRIIGKEIQYKEVWYEKKPIILAVLVPNEDPDEAAEFEGFNGESWWDSPLNQFVQSLPEERRKREYAKTRFVVNVFDRTPVIKYNGSVYYPNQSGKYVILDDKGKVVSADQYSQPEPHNTVLVLNQSGGKADGKHLLQAIITASEQMMSYTTGKPISIYEGDLKIVTKAGEITTRQVYPDMNQSPTEVTQIYDLEAYVKPWPHAAQQELLDGGDYATIKKAYNLPYYPQLVDVSDDDLPF